MPPCSQTRRVFSVLTLLTLAFLGFYLRLALHPGYATDHPPRLSVTLAHISTVAQRTSVLEYERTNFGQGWAAAPQLGGSCTTRDAIIAMSLANVAFSSRCTPTSGVGPDPYTGSQLRVGETPIEIDHVYPLRAAWDMGAHSWDTSKRLAFANDPMNLVATSKKENQDKSDSLPSEWLPSGIGARCWYVRRLAYVAAAYGLPLTTADVAVMRRQCWVRDLLRG